MSSYTEQDEVEKLKAWWNNYGSSLIAGVAVGVLFLVGQKYWTSYQEKQLAAAAQTYQELVQYAQQGNLAGARERSTILFDKYGSTPYAGLAGLIIGRYEMEAGNIAAARHALQQALDRGEDDATLHAARLNLARALAAEGKTEQALALVAEPKVAGFESQYAELRGDLLQRLGKKTEAHAAYESALKTLPPGSPYREVLTMKRDNLNVGAPQ